MKKQYTLFVRVSAVILCLLLITLYVATLVFSLMNTPSADWLFRASIAATFFVPVILYMLLLVAKNKMKATEELLAELTNEAKSNEESETDSDLPTTDAETAAAAGKDLTKEL
ncbi:MAG: hypothetical protein SPL15_05980 [Lachnospiraceae bacterium]|nr:hypothetical protein [Lachnospiraceae bacterium]MDY5742528.1 hypothetical protein [Lachnospiraceae bacterium]